MLKSAMKFTAVLVLAGGLMACDNKPDSNPEPTPPPGKPMVEQQAAPAQKAQQVAPAGGIRVALLQDKMSFHLPEGFSDQSQQTGVKNTPESVTQLFIDVNSRQLVVTSEVIPPSSELLDNSDASYQGLSKGLMSGLSNQYENIQKTNENSLTLDGQRFERLDTIQSVKGQKVVAATLFTIQNKKVVTLQIVTPADREDDHNKLVQNIIDTLKVS